MPVCLICGKEMQWLDSPHGEEYNQVDDGGNVAITFHYGSKHDMGIGFSGAEPLKAYIHDDCFDLVKSRIEGEIPSL